MWILIVIFIIIAVFAFIKIKKYKEQQERERIKQEEQRKKEQARKEQIERNRKIYWNCLPNIYNKQTTQTLQKAKSLLQTMQRYSCDLDDPNFQYKTDMWADANNNLKKLLGYPKWKYGETDAYISEQAVWYDLDMKYINNLLNRK